MRSTEPLPTRLEFLVQADSEFTIIVIGGLFPG